MAEEVIIHYLEMTSRDDMRPSSRAPAFVLRQALVPCPEFSRFLYSAVGRDWQWIDRLSWADERWQEYLDRAELETWVAYVEGNPIGYVELEVQAGGDVQIAYFGLLRQFVGRGHGGPLLTRALVRAWDGLGATRVWVHTCSLDHPAALPNYQRRGFRVYRQETTGQPAPVTTSPSR